MAEVMDNGLIVGGLPEPDDREAGIRSRNARRVSRRAQAAVLSESIARTSGADLDRAGDTRRSGGTFEAIEAVPDRTTPDRQGLDLTDFAGLLKALSFGGQEQVLTKNTFLSSFGSGVLGLNLPAQPTATKKPAEGK